MDNKNGSLPLTGTEDSELMRKSTSESKHLVVLRGKKGGIKHIHWHQRECLPKWFHSAYNIGTKQQTSYSKITNWHKYRLDELIGQSTTPNETARKCYFYQSWIKIAVDHSERKTMAHFWI